MRFSIEESELLNNLFEHPGELTKPEAISMLEEAKANTNTPDLVDIADSALRKIRALDVNSFSNVFNSFPVDNITVY